MAGRPFGPPGHFDIPADLRRSPSQAKPARSGNRACIWRGTPDSVSAGSPFVCTAAGWQASSGLKWRSPCTKRTGRGLSRSIEREQEGQNEDHRHVPDGMWTCSRPIGASSEPCSAVNRERGQHGRRRNTRLTGHRDSPDHESDRSPSPQRIHEDRFPGNIALTPGPRRGHGGEPGGPARSTRAWRICRRPPSSVPST